MAPGPLSKVKVEIARRMRQAGSPTATIAKMLAEPEEKILNAIEPVAPLSVGAMNGGPNLAKANAARRKPEITRAQTSGGSVKADRSEIEARLAEIPTDTRDLTGRIFGDPLHGRRAIDRRSEGAK